MKLTFDQDTVRTLAEHAVAADEHHYPYGIDPDGNVGDDAAPAGPQLHLVYDEGIYLMSNGNDHPTNPDYKPGAQVAGPGRYIESPNLVAYADQANPKTMGSGEAYEAKRAIAGGDDGVDFVDARNVLAILDEGTFSIDLTPTHIALLCTAPA